MNLAKNCRTCLQQTIEEPVPITPKLYEFLEDKLGIRRVPRVHLHLELPQNVCFDCFRNLVAFKRFHAQCRDAEAFFKMKLDNFLIQLQSKVDAEKLEEAINNSDSSEVNAEYEVVDESNGPEENQNTDGNNFDKHYDIGDTVDTYEISNSLENNVNSTLTDLKEASNGSLQHNTDSTVELCSNDEILYEHKTEEDIEHSEYDEEETIMFVELDENPESGTDYKTVTKNNSPNTQLDLKSGDQEPSQEGYINRKRRFQCHTCEKRFSNRYDLQTHENIHNGIKPFACDVCGKCFRQRNVLRTHQTLHFGKTIECELCEKTFARKSQLILHDRMHRNLKPFKCDYDEHCGAEFRERQHLMAHQKIHSGVRGHQCEQCSSAFYHRKGLLSHLRDVHGGVCYQCDLCRRSFNKPYKIRRHMHALHNIQLTDVSQYRTSNNSKPVSEELSDNLIWELK